MQFSRLHKILLAILSGILLSLSWPPEGFSLISFLALIPILLIEETINPNYKKPRLAIFAYSFIAFIIWNLYSVSWLSFASGAGGYAIVVSNALLMCIPFQLFYLSKKHFGERIGYASLPIFWISFEYLHFNWELAFPWLTFGNVFSTTPSLVQWYEYTGVLGGTLWIILLNILIFQAMKSVIEKKNNKWHLIKPSILLLLPVLISFLLLKKEIVADRSVEIAIVQPNIDPYFEKFSGSSLKHQLDILIRLSNDVVTSETSFLLWPETALLHFNLNNPEKNQQTPEIRTFLDRFPQLNIITGASAHEIYDSVKTPTTRISRNGTIYDEFNSSLHFAKNKKVGVYQKSKLVPMVENIPYPGLLNILTKFTVDLGGAMGSLGKQDTREVFFSKDSIGITPIVCYESVFGAYATDFTTNGGQIFAILTNDAWWKYPENGNGPFIGSDKGYKQHFHYNRLRAIENRRTVVRSANTGISGVINIWGEPIITTEYWQETSFKAIIPIYSQLTFYTKYGNYIGRLSVILASLILLLRFISIRTENFKYRR